MGEPITKTHTWDSSEYDFLFRDENGNFVSVQEEHEPDGSTDSSQEKEPARKVVLA